MEKKKALSFDGFIRTIVLRHCQCIISQSEDIFQIFITIFFYN